MEISWEVELDKSRLTERENGVAHCRQWLCLKYIAPTQWSIYANRDQTAGVAEVWIFEMSVRRPIRCFARHSSPGESYDLGRGSWLAWADDTAAHYAAVHCPCKRTTGPAVQHADIPPPQSIAGKLLLISRPTDGRRLSWPERTVG